MYRAAQLPIIDKYLLEEKVGIKSYEMLDHEEV